MAEPTHADIMAAIAALGEQTGRVAGRLADTEAAVAGLASRMTVNETATARLTDIAIRLAETTMNLMELTTRLADATTRVAETTTQLVDTTVGFRAALMERIAQMHDSVEHLRRQ